MRRWSQDLPRGLKSLPIEYGRALRDVRCTCSSPCNDAHGIYDRWVLIFRSFWPGRVENKVGAAAVSLEATRQVGDDKEERIIIVPFTLSLAEAWSLIENFWQRE